MTKKTFYLLFLGLFIFSIKMFSLSPMVAQDHFGSAEANHKAIAKLPKRNSAITAFFDTRFTYELESNFEFETLQDGGDALPTAAFSKRFFTYHIFNNTLPNYIFGGLYNGIAIYKIISNYRI